ncbi:hypothetical protein [Vibrio phage vB_Va_Val-yong3]|nr:hypothetical protein [Vibrio phage vB_Va_Val-yong3]
MGLGLAYDLRNRSDGCEVFPHFTVAHFIAVEVAQLPLCLSRSQVLKAVPKYEKTPPMARFEIACGCKNRTLINLYPNYRTFATTCCVLFIAKALHGVFSVANIISPTSVVMYRPSGICFN